MAVIVENSRFFISLDSSLYDPAASLAGEEALHKDATRWVAKLVKKIDTQMFSLFSLGNWIEK
jgi:hypothetical protein